MHKVLFGFLIGLAACSPGDRDLSAVASSIPPVARPERAPAPAPVDHAPRVEPNDGPFTGVWQECDDNTSPDECSRYVLIQRGAQICGTWSYVATADVYSGQVQATALSATRARRTRICGRSGSETQTECSAGWESIDRPLQLCNGRLSDSAGGSGACNGRYERSMSSGEQAAELAAEPWVAACLAAGAGGRR